MIRARCKQEATGPRRFLPSRLAAEEVTAAMQFQVRKQLAFLSEEKADWVVMATMLRLAQTVATSTRAAVNLTVFMPNLSVAAVATGALPSARLLVAHL